MVDKGLNMVSELRALGYPSRDRKLRGRSVIEVKASHNFSMIRNTLVEQNLRPANLCREPPWQLGPPRRADIHMVNSIKMAKGGVVVGVAIMLHPGIKAKRRDKDPSHFGQFLSSLDGFPSSEIKHGVSFKSNVEVANNSDEPFSWVQLCLFVQVLNMCCDMRDLVRLKAEEVNINKSENLVIINESSF